MDFVKTFTTFYYKSRLLFSSVKLLNYKKDVTFKFQVSCKCRYSFGERTIIRSYFVHSILRLFDQDKDFENIKLIKLSI